MEDPIYVYTIEEACSDGILFDVRTLLKPEARDKALISHITTNLMRKHGYYIQDETIEEKPNIVNTLELCSQAYQILVKQKDETDWMYKGEIETPNGSKLEIWIQFNEIHRFTVMLPEDY